MQTNKLARVASCGVALVLVFLATTLYAPAAFAGEEKATAEASNAYSWVQATASSPWSPRDGHAMVVFHDKIWVLGGENDRGQRLSDVWSSPDGVNWTQATATAPWLDRAGHRAAVLADKIWVLGGDAGDIRNDVWCSSDGMNWENPVASAPWSTRYGHSVVALDNGLWLLGGSGSRSENLNDVWFSSDATNWTLVVEHAAWTGRSGLTSTAFQGKLWMAGGGNWDGLHLNPLNDCWCSTDGVNWIQATRQAGWHARDSLVMEAFDDRLWVLGGAYTLGSGPGSYLVFLNDVWNSVDGASWVQMPDAPWAPRLGHTSVVSDGKLWILGGWTKVGSDEAAEANDGWYMTAPPPLSFTRLPMGGWKEEGQPLTLDVGVTGGVGTPRYQWVKDGTDLPAATTDTYSIASLTLEDSGAYTCRVTDDSKALHETPPALITVVPAGSLPVCGVTTAALTALGCLLAALQRLAHRREHRDAT